MVNLSCGPLGHWHSAGSTSPCVGWCCLAMILYYSFDEWIITQRGENRWSAKRKSEAMTAACDDYCWWPRSHWKRSALSFFRPFYTCRARSKTLLQPTYCHCTLLGWTKGANSYTNDVVLLYNIMTLFKFVIYSISQGLRRVY